MAAQCRECQKPIDLAEESAGEAGAICAECRALAEAKGKNNADDDGWGAVETSAATTSADAVASAAKTSAAASDATMATSSGATSGAKPGGATSSKAASDANNANTANTANNANKKSADKPLGNGGAKEPAKSKPAFWAADEESTEGGKRASRPLRPLRERLQAQTANKAPLSKQPTRPGPLSAKSTNAATAALGGKAAEEPIEAEPNSTMTDLRTILEAGDGDARNRRVDDDLIRLQSSFFAGGDAAHASAPPPPMPALSTEPTADGSPADADAPCPRCGAVRGVPPPSPTSDEAKAEDKAPAAPVVARALPPVVERALDRLPPRAQDVAERIVRDSRTPWFIAAGSAFVALLVLVWPHSAPQPSLNEATPFVAAKLAGVGAGAESDTAAAPAATGKSASPDTTEAVMPKARAAAAENRAAVAPSSAPTAAAALDNSDSQSSPGAAGAGRSFDRSSAMSAMSAAASSAAGCHKGSDPKGSSKVTVTFAPSGHVKDVAVGAPFSGTKTGACIANLFHSITVPAFDGAPIAASKSVNVH